MQYILLYSLYVMQESLCFEGWNDFSATVLLYEWEREKILWMWMEYPESTYADDHQLVSGELMNTKFIDIIHIPHVTQ